MTTIHAYAATEAGGTLSPFTFEVGPLPPDEVEIDVMSCGICHSDLSVLDNDWGTTVYPFVPGHEAIGKIAAIGSRVSHLAVGQTVGLGWVSRSCMTCHSCMSGDHNLCLREQTIIKRHGAFANKVRCQSTWAIPLPEGITPAKAGPLFCGGLTVFNAIVQSHVRPTDRVGVIGIGGLGHLALQFLHKWGCEVTAFTSNPDKAEEAIAMGAHHILHSRSDAALNNAAKSFDFILSTVGVSLHWNKILATLAPRGHLQLVGVLLEPIPLATFSILRGQQSISANPVGSPSTTTTMLDFCARHHIEAKTEHFPMENVNQALTHLREGKARYRVILDRSLS